MTTLSEADGPASPPGRRLDGEGSAGAPPPGEATGRTTLVPVSPESPGELPSKDSILAPPRTSRFYSTLAGQESEEMTSLRNKLRSTVGHEAGTTGFRTAPYPSRSRETRRGLTEPVVFRTLSEAALETRAETLAGSAAEREDELLEDLPDPPAVEYVADGSDQPYLQEIRELLPGLEQRARADAENAELWQALGEGQLAVGDAQAAARSFEAAVAITLSNPEHMLLLARARFAVGEFGAVVDLVKDALKHEPRRTRPYLLLLAEAYQKQGMFDQEVDTCVEALRGAPKEAALLFRLGLAYTHRGLSELAYRAFTLALREDPELHEARLNLGALLRSQGSTALAIRTFREALQRRPDSWEAYYNLGFLYAQIKAHARAIWAYRRAFRACPFPEALSAISYNLGIVCVQMKLWREAADAFRNATDYKPEN
ncbi:MAG: tetratricopeptide repeat protein, partial [Candidatus Riflebacteria bacterium]|nr:tetratricopeptide repeat protein [Candidatus Riflebacteria bacterium]